jgi:hypothetical protein
MVGKSILVRIGEKLNHVSIKAKESVMELACDAFLKLCLFQDFAFI